MNILLFGVSNVGKTSAGKILANTLGYLLHDVDEEVKVRNRTSLEDFVNNGTLEDHDKMRGKIIRDLVNLDKNIVIAVTPMSYLNYVKDSLDKDCVFPIELRDTAKNIFDRLVFSDEQDNLYHDDDYKNAHKKYYLGEIQKDINWYGKIYFNIEHKYDMNNESPDNVVDGIIKKFKFQKV